MPASKSIIVYGDNHMKNRLTFVYTVTYDQDGIFYLPSVMADEACLLTGASDCYWIVPNTYPMGGCKWLDA
jgi:hypothetical protein